MSCHPLRWWPKQCTLHSNFKGLQTYTIHYICTNTIHYICTNTIHYICTHYICTYTIHCICTNTIHYIRTNTMHYICTNTVHYKCTNTIHYIYMYTYTIHYICRVSHQLSATRCFRTLVHRDYATYQLEFCIITTLDPQHPAHRVLQNFIKDCVFGEPLSVCPNRMLIWQKVSIFRQQFLNHQRCTEFHTIW